MESLVAIGIDVHKEKFALVAILLVLGAQDQILGEIEVGPDGTTRDCPCFSGSGFCRLSFCFLTPMSSMAMQTLLSGVRAG